MSSNFNKEANGYLETIQQGLAAIRKFRSGFSAGSGNHDEKIAKLKQELMTAERIVVGAGAGLSTSAGLTYSGERFDRYFFDFKARFGIRDMYSGGFWTFPDDETRWAWWARHIYYNRYIAPPKPVYESLLSLLKDKTCFVITTNVDHQFQRAGFDQKRLFCTQGDYGLFQSVNPSVQITWGNEEWVMEAMAAQRFIRDENGIFQVPQNRQLSMRIPHELIPRSPDGQAVTMNLRSDQTFVEDKNWQEASANYAGFLKACEGKHVLFLELGVGSNTPVIIKYPFWAMTAANPKGIYACVSLTDAVCPREIEPQSICIEGDAGNTINLLR